MPTRQRASWRRRLHSTTMPSLPTSANHARGLNRLRARVCATSHAPSSPSPELASAQRKARARPSARARPAAEKPRMPRLNSALFAAAAPSTSMAFVPACSTARTAVAVTHLLRATPCLSARARCHLLHLRAPRAMVARASASACARTPCEPECSSARASPPVSPACSLRSIAALSPRTGGLRTPVCARWPSPAPAAARLAPPFVR
mmetsp:Transcript_170/g.361  ORF Transcript_170/g.361 Transcript_170/m.361 type:complete len:206 (+) Transcript_170:154-771(+)